MLRRRLLSNEGGNAAAEFAMALPVVLFLLFGTLNLCLTIYAAVCLHAAVEDAARYAATYAAANGADPATGSSSPVVTFAQKHYFGPGLKSQAFVFSIVTTNDSTCPAINSNSAVTNTQPSYEGYKVTGSGSYNVYYGLGTIPFALNAAACFN